MAADWPATLPQAPASFNLQSSSNVVRTEPDTGPTKTRRRFTKAKKTASMTFVITIAQYLVLDDFYHNTLADGSIPMNFVHPWTQQMLPMTITQPPTYNNDNNLGVNASVQVEYF